MFIRTDSNIYEINEKEDIIIKDKEITGYYIGETDVIKEEQVIAEDASEVENLVDCFCLFVDGRIRWSSEDIYEIEDLAVRYPDDSVQIFGMIWSIDRFGTIKTKIVVTHDVDADGNGFYRLIN